jgi:hypothetical protein
MAVRSGYLGFWSSFMICRVLLIGACLVAVDKQRAEEFSEDVGGGGVGW